MSETVIDVQVIADPENAGAQGVSLSRSGTSDPEPKALATALRWAALLRIVVDLKPGFLSNM